MLKASVRMISLAFKLWQPSACLMLIIILLYSDGHHVVHAEEAGADAPTSSEPPQPPLVNQAIGGIASNVPSAILFNQTKSLTCDTREKTPGYITTVFLYTPPYVFGCLSNDASSYYFSVALSGINFPNTPVWLANRHHPVTDSSSLFLTPQGTLQLQDSNGTQIWSSGQGSNSNSSNPVGLRLTGEGNLIFYDDQNKSLWESFWEPLDLLVPGQFLNPGSKLVAGSSSRANRTGNFVAMMEPGGLIFYENSTSRPLPYYALRYPLIPTDVDGVLQSPCNHTQLQLSSTTLIQVQVVNTPACTVPESAISFGSPVVFIRLELNGVFKGYYPDHKPSYDLFQNSSKGLCGIPNACGPYGICEDSACKCAPGNQSSDEFFTSASQEFLLTSSSCIPKVAPRTCDEGGVTDYEFLDVQQVDYFANDFIPATLLTENFEQCKAACARNCTCWAAFYRNSSKACYLHESVMSMIRVQNASYVATIKLQKEASSSLGKSEMGLIIGLSVALFASVCLFGGWYIRHKRKHKPLSKDEDALFSSLPGQAKRFTFKELQRVTHEFSEKLGVGGFGSVYRGVLTDGNVVAVKQLENTTRSAQGMKEFKNEVMALSNINHQNLVHLRGFCADGGHRLLVYEYVPNGSLDVWLFKKGAERPGPPLDWKTRLAIAVHTARGLVFLHEQCRNRIVHLDIKPQNILLDQQFAPKLADFGLSRLINEDDNTAVSRMRGTPGYMAPECLILTDATEKSDVYSFGMVLLEIVSGRKNVDVSRLVVHGDGEGWYFPAMAARKFREGNITDIIDKSFGKLGKEEMAEAIRMIKIAFWCIQDDPSLRPTMGNTLLMLEGYSKVAEPPLSNNFGMQFHLSNSLQTNARTPQQAAPQQNSSPKRSFESRDHHQPESESEAKMPNQGVEEEPKGSACECTSPLLSPQASPRTPSAFISPLPSSDFHQTSPHQSPPPNIPSPRTTPVLKSFMSFPHRASPVSSPRRNSPLPLSPLSHNSASPFQESHNLSRYPSSTPSTYLSPISSPGNT